MIIVSSTSMKLTSLSCIAFSSQTSYLIIENLYHKQKTLLVKIEKELKTKVLKIKIYLKELERLDAKKAVVVAQKAMKQEVVVVVEKTAKQVVMKAVKLETCSKDIDFFDFTMMMNLSKLHLYVNCASFLQILNEQAVKYQKSNVLKTLQTNLRDSALIWFKDRLKFASLNDFKKILAKIFSSIISFDSIIINSSSRFHICLECVVQFSSTSRFLTHAQKSCNKIFTCKHCEQEFNSNNKLHEHVKLSHSKTFAKTLRQRFVEERSKHINLFVTSVSVMILANFSVIFFISSTTFKSMSTSARSSHLFNAMIQAQAACFKTFSTDFSITSTNLTASILDLDLTQDHKFLTTSNSKTSLMRSKSDYFITSSITFKSTSTISESSHQSITMIKASINCSLTFSSTRFQISMILHQKSLKSYMTMKNLFVMFAEKRFRKSLNYIHKRMRFSMSDQIKIINYFKFVDQSNFTSINSFKSSSLISCSRSTSRVFFSVNQVTRTSQYQHIAIDAISNLKIQRRLKTFRQEYMIDADVIHINEDNCVERSSTITKKVNAIKSSIKSSIKSVYSSKIKWLKSSSLISCFCSTFRLCSSFNQTTKFSQYQHIAIDQTSSLENQSKINMQSFCQSLRQKYLVDADVTHINLNIRVETTLTEAKEYKLIKSLIKSFKSVKLFKELKFSTCIDEFSSILRLWHSIN